jgi:hypothetical protein
MQRNWRKLIAGLAFSLMYKRYVGVLGEGASRNSAGCRGKQMAEPSPDSALIKIVGPLIGAVIGGATAWLPGALSAIGPALGALLVAMRARRASCNPAEICRPRGNDV